MHPSKPFLQDRILPDTVDDLQYPGKTIIYCSSKQLAPIGQDSQTF